jgi:hypothetical protein
MSYFISRVSTILAQHNRSVVCWQDVGADLPASVLSSVVLQYWKTPSDYPANSVESWGLYLGTI